MPHFHNAKNTQGMPESKGYGSTRSGRHFLQVPGPTNVPDRVLLAMAQPTMDHRSAAFSDLTLQILPRLQKVFNASGPAIMFPSSATGAWEASIVNTLSPGDKVLMFDSGVFAGNWKNIADRFGLDVDLVACDWRVGVDPSVIEDRLKADKGHAIKAVMVVHNETSTGITNAIADARAAIDAAGHPALYLVDAVSSGGSIEIRHDDWQIDVIVTGSQKGLMLPPGLSFNIVSEKALAISESASLPSSYWNWHDMVQANKTGFFPYTPATNLMYGLLEALKMMEAEGMDAIYARHARHGEATRRALAAWGIENFCTAPEKSSNTVTAVKMPDGHNADELRKVISDRFDMSLGAGLGPLAGNVFRIGHLGDFNDLTLLGTLAGVEMGLGIAGVPANSGGVAAAMQYLADTAN
jgi:alanine-glyoxylate transaminase/serine-glyoxylate transaminase/serine-pyruvate transaminase